MMRFSYQCQKLRFYPGRSFSSQIKLHGVFVIDDILSAEDEAIIVQFLDVVLRRKRYEGNHWDDVIVKYKEVELDMHLKRAEKGQYGKEGLLSDSNLSNLRQKLQTLPTRLKQVLCNDPYCLNKDQIEQITLLPPHAIDLSEDGWIGPHVDSIKFSGDMIAGVSFLSTRTMRLTLLPKDEVHFPPGYQDLDEYWRKNPYEQHAKEKDVVLPPRSLYILTGIWRYGYQHAILPSPGHRRLSIIYRNNVPVPTWGQ